MTDLTDFIDAIIINAGDGTHEHPTQAILDIMNEIDSNNDGVISLAEFNNAIDIFLQSVMFNEDQDKQARSSADYKDNQVERDESGRKDGPNGQSHLIGVGQPLQGVESRKGSLVGENPKTGTSEVENQKGENSIDYGEQGQIVELEQIDVKIMETPQNHKEQVQIGKKDNDQYYSN